MTPNTPSAPSRRTFLSSTAAAALAVGGGLPLLAACGSSDTGSKEGTTAGKSAQKLLPAFVARNVVTPDIAAKNGSAAGFTQAIAADQLKASVESKLGKGSKIKIMSPFWGTPPANDNTYYKAMNAAIGVETTWQNQDGNTYDQKLGAVLASSAIPDVVVVPGWNLGGKIPTAINAKFEDLGPYLSGDKVKAYPNLAAIPSDAWQRSIFGGKLRGLPMPASYVTNIAPFYRKDIFEAKGWTLPKSADEFLALAKEITSAKAKVWACDDMSWTAYNMFGVLNGSDKALGWNLESGKLINRIETDGYLEALEWTRKLFSSGVVHPDAKAQNQGDAGNRFTAGQVLIYNNDLSGWYGKSAEQAAANPKFKMAAMDIFGHDGGDPKLWATNPAGIWAFIKKGSSKAVIADILAIANFCSAPYGTKERMLTDYGVEGSDYTVKNNLPVKTDTGNAEVNGAWGYMSSSAAYVAHPDMPDITKAMVEWQQRMGAFTTKSSFYGMTITEPSRWTNLMNDFEQLEKDIVRGRKKVSDMQQAVSEWKSKGGDQLRDWYKKLLDANGTTAS
ncbi:extracellular solute-binding protein [Streptomyces beijiangensis]|uniref:Extracellular solute-binding protein n=1 Tax=Streptomyces beijiangensis TaxID=163361 RepID=A0A939FCQ0_9ACTN|nr:extracellular solute-binding protein [Streptomyces beijiangensis]MBO0516655.1 extracellular solute-binding protein [Streptomyces beijiangensis]